MLTSDLPAVVAAICDAPIRLNSSRIAMRDLATELNDVPDDRLPYVMATINGMGLMYCQWWLRLSVFLGSKRAGVSKTETWLKVFNQLRHKQGEDTLQLLLKEMREQTVDHILIGKDREDGNSVGGFSKREAQAVSNILAVSRRYETSPIRVYMQAACNQSHGRVL